MTRFRAFPATCLPSRPQPVAQRRQAGFTLVEILVALTVGLIVAAAAVAALLIGRQGFTSADSSTQLRENTRFAASLIQRIVIQTGFENIADGDFPAPGFPALPPDASYLRGYDNASVGTTGDVGLSHDSRACGGVTDTSCANQSDVLVVRYKGASRSGTADNSMIDCAGHPEPAGTLTKPYGISIFNVKRSEAGEPTLMCTYLDDTTGNWTDVPLIQGVESFQVLYGTDGVTAGTVSGDPNVDALDITKAGVNNDTIPDRYLRAVDLDVAGAYNRNNWVRVRSVRIGLVLRGPAGSAVDRTNAAPPPLDVLGIGFTKAEDQLTVPGNDGRLRQQLVLTVHLRNPQSAPPSP